MKEEKKELNIYEKLQLCRVELQNKKLKKSGKNNYSGFTYYELNDLLPTINEILNAHGLFSMFNIQGEIATLKIILGDKEIEFTSPIAEANLKGATPVQGLGAIHTYMKRYLYLNAFEIAQSDLLDENAGSDNVQNENMESIILIPTITKLVDETDTDLDKVLETYKVKKFEELTLRNLKSLEKILTDRKKKQDKEKQEQQKQNIPTT